MAVVPDGPPVHVTLQNQDSDIAKIDGIELTRDWTRYRVPLEKLDLSSIKTGFVVTLRGRSTPVTIYLDSIRFVR